MEFLHKTSVDQLDRDIFDALEALKTQFESIKIQLDNTSCENVHVQIENVNLGEPYLQDYVWIGFTLNSNFTEYDVYPHYISPSLARKDGIDLNESTQSKFSKNVFHQDQKWPPSPPDIGNPAIMISIKHHNPLDFGVKWPLKKLQIVIREIRAL